MAKRRMFSLDVVDSDKFLDMPATTQALYFHLGMRADDCGHIKNIHSLLKIIHCGECDLQILNDKGYIKITESGCIVLNIVYKEYTERIEGGGAG